MTGESIFCRLARLMKDHVSGGTEGDRKRRSLKTPLSRSLSLEPLETRALLSATDWGGFDGCPDRNDYSVLQSEIDIDLSGIDPDLVAMADFNQDGKDDLVIVCHDDTTPEITLFLGDGNGAFQRSITTSLMTTNVVGTLLADVTGDALPDFITFSQNSIDGSILNIDLYAARSDGSFAFSKTSEVSLSVFGNYATYVIAGVNGVYLGDSMVIQLQNSYAFDSVGNYYSLNGAAYASNDGTGGFLALRLFSSLTGTAKGSVTIDSIDYLVSQNLSTRTFQFWTFNPQKNTWSSAGSLRYVGEQGPLNLTAVTGVENHLYFAGNVAGKTWVTDFDLAIMEGKVTLVESAAYELAGYFAGGTLMVSGDLNGDSVGDLFIVEGTDYTALIGDGEGGMTEAGSSVPKTGYLTSMAVDLNGDALEDLLVVGTSGVWMIDGTNLNGDPVPVGRFVTEAVKGLFGDFDGDGVMELAILDQTASIGVYDWSGGVFSLRWTVSPPTKTVSGTTITATASDMIATRLTQTSRDQLAIYFTWSNGSAATLYLWDAVTGTTQTLAGLKSGETVTALASGKIYGGNKEDLAAVVVSGTSVSVVTWKNNGSGSMARQSGISLGTVSTVSVKSLAIGDLNRDGLADLAFLDSGTGFGGGLGWLLQTNAGFTPADLYWGEMVASTGNFGGLLLADITGDGFLDAFTTLTVDTDGIAKTSIYLAKGDSTSATGGYLGALENYPLKGEFSDGMEFVSAGTDGPAITLWPNEKNGFGDILLASGNSEIILRSRPESTGEESLLYLVRSVETGKPVAILSDLSEGIAGSYSWIDEWSRFYLEIWGTNGGLDLESFQTGLHYQTNYYAYSGTCDVADGWDVVVTDFADGTISLSGTITTESIPVEAGSYLFLARLLFVPATGKGVGIPIPENGAFLAYDAEIHVIAGEESINDSKGCAKSVTDALDDLTIFSVRLDYNDDGAVDVIDFTYFANNYGYGTIEKPFKDSKAATFNIVGGNGLDVQDFVIFANSYGNSRAKTVTRFYDEIAIDPTVLLNAVTSLLPLEEDPIPDFSETASFTPLNAPVDVALEDWDNDLADGDLVSFEEEDRQIDFTPRESVLPLPTGQMANDPLRKDSDDWGWSFF